MFLDFYFETFWIFWLVIVLIGLVSFDIVLHLWKLINDES